MCIDGGRGSGKTYTLLSIERALRELPVCVHGPKISNDWKDFFDEAIEEKVFKNLQSRADPRKALSHVLRIIFPGDMEGDESLMETIFASMRDTLVPPQDDDPLDSAEVAERKKRLRDPETKKKSDELARELRESVAEGWYFARHFGHDAIIRDSIDYRDFVERFERESHKSANRIRQWRGFVDKYLDFHNAVMLVVLLDDSDIQPELAQNILHAIRMFLNHPRIVTVLAGNIRAMRANLLHLAMRRISSSTRALTQHDQQTAQEWRRSERRAIEEYLEKVLPPAQRFFLRAPTLQPQSSSTTPDKSPKVSDFKKLTKLELLEICLKRFLDTRDKFLTVKFNLALRREILFEDQPSSGQQRTIADFLSWWVFANRYADLLAPKSARQIATFGHYFVRDVKKLDSEGKQFAVKRLPVMLHDVPDNFMLVQRFTDEDASVSRWVSQQALSSVWVGQRMFLINGREIPQGSYTYDYLRYRLDIGLSMPIRDNAEESVSERLLPLVRGRRHIRRFYQPRNMPRQQRRYGVSKLMDHAAIPSNCAYFSDLAALPDVSLISEAEMARQESLQKDMQKGTWEDELASRWVELLDDDQKELLVRYFTEVVCQRLRRTERISAAAFMSLLDPLSSGGELVQNLYDYSVDWEISAYREEEDIGPALYAEALLLLTNPGAGAPTVDWEGRPAIAKTARMYALFAALVNDLRRAWHAIRIHEMAPKWMESGELASNELEYGRNSRALASNQSKMLLYDLDRLQRVFDKSPWTKNLLRLFQYQNIKAALDEEIKRNLLVPDLFLNINDDIRYIFAITGSGETVGETDDKKIPGEGAGEEDADYAKWIKAIRHVGRIFYEAWPIYYHDDGLHPIAIETCIKLPEGEGVLEGWQLDVSHAPLLDTFEGRRHQRYAREARQFIWLMSGLAPSLPAIIHSNVMARIYEAETLLRIHKGKTSPRAVQLYEDAINEIERWFGLVGSLTFAVRYIKIKCLHLFAKLFIDAALEPQQDPGELIAFLKLCGIEGKDPDSVFKELRDKFGSEISNQLAMMPDVSPSSLFGEQWMVDLIKYSTIGRALSDPTKRGDKDPVEEDRADIVRGMFGETEQWLWATHRCLRKLDKTIKTRRAKNSSKQSVS
jgi:hypothetical protein